MRDDNSEWKQQQDEEEWHEHQRKLLEGFELLRPVIKGEKKYQDVIDDFDRIFTKEKQNGKSK